MSLDPIWRALAEDTVTPPTGYLARRVAITAPCDVYAAIEFPAATRTLLASVPSAALRRAGALPKTAGIEVRQVASNPPKPGLSTVAVRLSDSRYSDIFTVVADDLARQLGSATSLAASADVLVARLRKWQEFLDRFPPEGLGPLEQQGLFGELWLLSEILIPEIGTRTPVEGWLGPQAMSQDFHLPAATVEVKTSTAKSHTTLAISSARQLDSTGIAKLFLFYLGLDERRQDGDTLPGAVATLRQLLSGDPIAADVFETRLVEAGYLDCHAPLYAPVSYVVRERHAFLVGDGFPRIVEADLRNGVGNVRYTISLSECMHHRVEDSDFRAQICGA